MGRKQWILAVSAAIFVAAAAGVTTELTYRSKASQWRNGAAALISTHLAAAERATASVADDLARRLSTWDRLERSAVDRALGLAARNHPEVSRLMVADLQGRIIASNRPDTPPGRRSLSVGGLDAVEKRRKLLIDTGLSVLKPAVEAGAVVRLELAAPVRKADGEPRAYVAATASLAPLRERLAGLEKRIGRTIVVTDRDRNFIYPLRGGRRPGTSPVKIDGGWLIYLAAGRSPWIPVAAVAFLSALIAFGLGLFLLKRNDR